MREQTTEFVTPTRLYISVSEELFSLVLIKLANHIEHDIQWAEKFHVMTT